MSNLAINLPSSKTSMWNRTTLWGSKGRTSDEKEDKAERNAEFERLVTQDWERFWRFAFRLTGDRDNAEDLLSDTLLDALNCFDRYNGDRFDSWFFKILANNRIDMARKANRRRTESLDTAYSEEEGRDIPDKTAGPEAQFFEPLYSEPVQKALDKT